MASARLKEIFDNQVVKDVVDSLRYMERRFPIPWPDPHGPVKYDAYEGIMRSYLDTMPRVAQRIDSIETFLEKDLSQGKPYVRAEERPDVGADALTEMAKAVRLLEERMSKLEAVRKG